MLSASGRPFNRQASKGLSIAPVTFYGGLQYETFDVDYNYTPRDIGKVNISQTSDNTFRGLVGVTFTAVVVRINVDSAIGNAQNVVTTGFGCSPLPPPVTRP